MKLSVIGGVARGMKLVVPDSIADFRPTKNQIREALMSILVSDIAHADVLELCAGSSIMSLEFLSRGAKSATAVEIDHTRVTTIASQLSGKSLSEKLSLVVDSADHFLTSSADDFDLIFFDPPYYVNDLTNLLPLAMKKLRSYGVCVFEFASDDGYALLQVQSQVGEVTIKQYGNSSIAILRRD